MGRSFDQRLADKIRDGVLSEDFKACTLWVIFIVIPVVIFWVIILAVIKWAFVTLFS